MELLARAVHVARDELEGGVPVGGAALVVDRHPAGEVGPVVGGIEDEDVVGAPGDAAGEVRGLDALGRRRSVPEQPDERRLRDEVLGQGGQHHVPVVAHEDLAADVVDGPVGGQERRLDVRAGALVEPHLSPQVLLHELLARQEVVLVVLLEDLEAGGIGEGLEMHGGRVDLGGDVDELDLGRSPG